MRENQNKGGGVSIGIDARLTFRDLSQTTIPKFLLECFEMLLVQIVHNMFEIFIINIYISNYQ